MKVQLAVCAKDLPEAASYKATLVEADSGNRLGTTEASKSTTAPVWNKLITTVDDFPDDAKIDVQITKSDDENTIIASSTFALATLTSAYYKAAAQFTSQDGDEGAKIALHAETPVRMGKLHLQLAGHDLPDTDFGMFRKNHTDGFFEMYSAVTGKKLVRSVVVEDNLDPVWDALDLDLDLLCGGKFDAPIRITVLDKDEGDSTQYIGQIMVSVEQLQASATGSGLKHFPLIKGGTAVAQGSISVEKCELLPADFATRESHRNMELVLTALDAKRDKLVADVEAKQKAAADAQTAADIVQSAVDELKAKATELGAKQNEVQTNLAKLRQEYAEKQAEASKNVAPSGTLTIVLAAKNLPDTDLGFRNKTDPIYQIMVQNKQLLRSNIVENTLNPVWNEQSIKVADVGGVETPFTIIVSDKDGGSDKSMLGSTETTIQGLIKSVGSKTGQTLPPSKGKLFVRKAELTGVEDHMAGVEEFYKSTVEPAIDACTVATKTYEAVRAELEKAREKAATAKEAAMKAKDAADAAKLALEMLEKEG